MSMPAAEPSQPGRLVQGSPETVTALPVLPTKSIEELQEGTRQDIARRLIFAYLLLLGFTLVIPVVSLWIPHVGNNGYSVTDARDLMLAMSGTLTGLVGILGFVMGYYFKAFDKPPEGKVSTKRSTKKK